MTELSAAEHLEEAIRLLGWDRGPLSFEVVAENGRVKKIYPKPAAMGRHELDERRVLRRSDAA